MEVCVSGGIPALAQMLSSESLVLKEAATQTLSNLTHNNQLNALWVPNDIHLECLYLQIFSYSCIRSAVDISSNFPCTPHLSLPDLIFLILRYSSTYYLFFYIYCTQPINLSVWGTYTLQKYSMIKSSCSCYLFYATFQGSVWGRGPCIPCSTAAWKLPEDGGQFCCHTLLHGRTGDHPL